MATAVSIYLSAKRGNKKVISLTAFTSLTKSIKDKPQKAGVLQPLKITASIFRLHYDKRDLQFLVKHESSTSIQWKDPSFDKCNYQLFLPIFADGIREVTDPHRFITI